MRRYPLATLAVLVVAAVVGQMTASAGTTKHACAFDLTGRFVEVSVVSGRPPQSGSNTGAATVDGTLCGKPFHGAARDVNHFPSFGKVNGVATIFAPLGSIAIRFGATATINADHSATLHGESSIVGGTGVYAHALGSGRDLGRQAPSSPVTVQRLTGTLDY